MKFQPLLSAALLAGCHATDRPPAPDASAPPPKPEPQAQVYGPHDVDAVYLMHPWAAKGGDCRQPDFTIDQDQTGGLAVVTTLNGTAQTGVVLQGQNPALRFGDTKLPVEGRGMDGLAVMPPVSGESVTLGGVKITGDGEVFIQCPERAG